MRRESPTKSMNEARDKRCARAAVQIELVRFLPLLKEVAEKEIYGVKTATVSFPELIEADASQARALWIRSVLCVQLKKHRIHRFAAMGRPVPRRFLVY